jgi:MFS family permease
MVINVVGVAASMLGCAFGNTIVCGVSLVLAGIFFGPGTVNVYVFGQTLAGPRAAGKWMSIQNCLGNISGIVGPLVTGFVIDRTGDFFWAFAVACAVTLLGLVGWVLMIPRVAPIAWPQHT